MVERDLCSTHLRKLGALPYFGTVQDAAFSSWISAASRCDDTPHLIRAVDSILQGRCLPESPEDITDAVNATRIHEQPAGIYQGGCCGRTIEGWTYLAHDPHSPANDVRKVLSASRCIGGWIQRTIWRAVVPARIDEEGNPVRQPYDFGGRCKCQPGGWI